MIRRCLLPCLLAFVTLAGTAPAEVRLERTFEEESQSRNRTEVKTDQVLTINGAPIETSARNTIVNVDEVGKRQADGTLPIRRRIEAFQAELNLPGGLVVSYSSENPEQKADNPQLEPVLDAFRASSQLVLDITLDNKNKAKDVKVAAPNEATLPEMFKSEFEPDYQKTLVMQELEQLPGSAVNKGDTWTRQSQWRFGGGQTMNFEAQYEYVGTTEQNGRTLDEIKVETKRVSYTMDPNSPSPLKVTASELKPTASEGRILFDREKGQIVESRESFRIEGDLTFSINGMQLPGKLDLKVEVTAKPLEEQKSR